MRDKIDLSLKLYRLRKEHNLTSEELADKLDLNPRTIRHYEAGTKRPSLETLFKICTFYEITIDELIKK